MTIIEARIRKLKGLSPVKLCKTLAKEEGCSVLSLPKVPLELDADSGAKNYSEVGMVKGGAIHDANLQSASDSEGETRDEQSGLEELDILGSDFGKKVSDAVRTLVLWIRLSLSLVFRCLRLVSSTSAETEPKDEENNDPGERKNSPSDGDGVDSEEEDEEEDDEDSGVTSPVSREPKMIDMEANGEKPTQAIDENEEVSEVLSQTHKNLALPQSTETPQLESWAKIVGTTLDEEENILGENEVQDEANLYEVQRNVVSPLSQSTTKQVLEIGILAHSDSSVAARRGDESELVDERDSVEEGNPRSVTPLAVGDHFGSVSSDAISDKTKKPKSSCGLERSNGAGDSVGNEVCASDPVEDGKWGILDSDMVVQTLREEGVQLVSVREAPLVAQGHSTGTETGKIEDEPFLDALIFGDEVIKLSSTHVDLEKREYKVASEGEVENGSKSKMGGSRMWDKSMGHPSHENGTKPVKGTSEEGAYPAASNVDPVISWANIAATGGSFFAQKLYDAVLLDLWNLSWRKELDLINESQLGRCSFQESFSYFGSDWVCV
ncbi:hypothetical protein U1Q18_040338 [Sarracenia purpurea var. burkii]